MFYWIMKHIVIGPILMAVFRPWTRGLENIPDEGPVILASNHISFVDSIFLPLVVDRRIAFLAKSEYFTGTGFKGWLTRLFFEAAGQLPIDRSGGKASEASLNTGLRVLADGKVLGLYPEGTRSPDGTLYRGRTGIARTVLASGAVVIPVAMIGTREIMPIGAKFPKIRRLGIIIGKPLDFSRFDGLEADRFILRSVTDEIVYELMQLGGQRYVDIYASSVRNRMVAPPVSSSDAASETATEGR